MSNSICNDIFDHNVFRDAKNRQHKYFTYLSRNQEVNQELYTCRICKGKRIATVSKQLRSSDEGTSVLASCLDCKNKWREG